MHIARVNHEFWDQKLARVNLKQAPQLLEDK